MSVAFRTKVLALSGEELRETEEQIRRKLSDQREVDSLLSPKDLYANLLRSTFHRREKNSHSLSGRVVREFSPSTRTFIFQFFSLMRASEKLVPYCRGTYFLGTFAVVKPMDEGRGMKNCRQGEAVVSDKIGVLAKNQAANEVIISELRNLRLNAALLEVTADFYSAKEACLQRMTKLSVVMRFISNARSPNREEIAHIERHSCEQLFLTDLAFYNSDRVIKNLLYHPETREIIGIDHACILSEYFQDPAIFCWSLWPQAQIPFSDETLKEIAQMDFERDREIIQRLFPGYSTRSLETMRITYYLVQKAALIGLSPFAIASFFLIPLEESIEELTQPIIRYVYVAARERAETPDSVFENICSLLEQPLEYLQKIDWGLERENLKEFQKEIYQDLKSIFIL